MPAAGGRGGWWTSFRRLTLPPLATSGSELLQAEGGAACGNSTVSSDSHLQISHRGPGQHQTYSLFDLQLIFSSGLLRWLSGKESACRAGDPGSNPGSGRSPGGGNSKSLQYSCLKNPMDRGAWWATVHGVAESQTRLKLLSTAASSKVHLFPFLGGQFSELSWVQSGHCVVNFSTWCFSIAKTALGTRLRI